MKVCFSIGTIVTACIVTACATADPDRAPADRAPLSAGQADSAAGQTAPEVRNIILMIADGAGAGLWTAARYASDTPLAVTRMPVAGLVHTQSAVHKVADSASGATVFATGKLGTNRTISVGPPDACPTPATRDAGERAWPPGCEPLRTWFESAKAKGRATGIVTTTNVVDATPAAFVAHSASRYWFESLAVQFADFDLDVLLGGGKSLFEAAVRVDERDLLGEICSRSDCLAAADDLATYRPTDRPLVGLLASGDMDDHEPRPATLPDMIDAALSKLERNPRGFVAMFETEATDNATHANAPLERLTADMLEFDRAVGVALDFAGRNPGTLVIVTADHETGGMTLMEEGTDFVLTYGGRGHSAALVPLFAIGPGAHRFGGLRDSPEIGQAFMDIVANW